ncbi:MAG: histidine phosphatase family protein [Acidimicrobiales bacterium]
MELLLIRHGLPVRVDEGTVAGPADPDLSERGLAQAAALADWLIGEAIDAIWVSPMRRAAQTAAPLVQRLGLPVVIDEDIAEYDRDAASYIPIEELKAANDPRWREVPEQPEHFQAVVVAAIERIVAAHPRQRVAVVCHGGVINAYAAHVLGIADPLFFLPQYTSISRVFAASTGERSVASLNETAHVRGLL